MWKSKQRKKMCASPRKLNLQSIWKPQVHLTHNINVSPEIYNLPPSLFWFFWNNPYLWSFFSFHFLSPCWYTEFTSVYMPGQSLVVSQSEVMKDLEPKLATAAWFTQTACQDGVVLKWRKCSFTCTSKLFSIRLQIAFVLTLSKLLFP